MITIKPCPFCESKDIGVKDSVLDERSFAYCRQCHSRGPIVNIPETSNISDEEIMKLAYKAWNKRK